MLRREVRLRKEYLYRKSLEAQQKAIQEKKQKLQYALDEGKPIPTELRKEEGELRKLLAYDDNKNSVPRDSAIDDEYQFAGVKDPKIMLTTSHDPSSRLKQFAKEFKLILPNSQRLNRGSYVLPQLVSACKANNVTDLIILHEHRGIPDGLIVSHLPFGPTAYFSLSNTVMRLIFLMLEKCLKLSLISYSIISNQSLVNVYVTSSDIYFLYQKKIQRGSSPLQTGMTIFPFVTILINLGKVDKLN